MRPCVRGVMGQSRARAAAPAGACGRLCWLPTTCSSGHQAVPARAPCPPRSPAQTRRSSAQPSSMCGGTPDCTRSSSQQWRSWAARTPVRLAFLGRRRIPAGCLHPDPGAAVHTPAPVEAACSRISNRRQSAAPLAPLAPCKARRTCAQPCPPPLPFRVLQQSRR